MNKPEYQAIVEKNKTQPLEFKLTEMNGNPCYIAEPYRVVHYNEWYTFSRVYEERYRAMVFGPSVEYGITYTTKEAAFEACQIHNDKLTGADHGSYRHSNE